MAYITSRSILCRPYVAVEENLLYCFPSILNILSAVLYTHPHRAGKTKMIGPLATECLFKSRERERKSRQCTLRFTTRSTLLDSCFQSLARGRWLHSASVREHAKAQLDKLDTILDHWNSLQGRLGIIVFIVTGTGS